MKNTYQQIKRSLYIGTYGWIATASFLICALSGVLLAVVFNVNEPYLSISRFLIVNPYADFVRNVHYWSAQSFLIFILFHLYDVFKRSAEDYVRNGLWFRLSFSLIVVVYVMISGFILKADADSTQAFRIITSLVGIIPYAGSFLQRVFIGPESNLQLIYVHHIATATIILFIIIYEHVRDIWPSARTFIYALLYISLASFFVRAPFNDLQDTVLKGPWYFVGMQEMLHWTSKPLIVMAFFFIVLLLIYFTRKAGPNLKIWIKSMLLFFAIVYIGLSIIGFFFRGENWSWQYPWQKGAVVKTGLTLKGVVGTGKFKAETDNIPVIMGRGEGCLMCHQKVSGFSASHDPAILGCFICHGGDPFTLDENQAHHGMVLIPGNLVSAERSCGTAACHPEIASRVPGSLMANMTGIVSVDRFVFGESNSLNGKTGINDIGHSAADEHLRDLCAVCHLGNMKDTLGPVSELFRGGGCLACHLNYGKDAKHALVKYKHRQEGDTALVRFHPSLDLNISNEHCFSCHNRSGRISTAYEGWHETLLDADSVLTDTNFRILGDGRVFKFIKSDIHHQKGMLCIDCHASYEVMGDGRAYAHKEQAVRIQCQDCHTHGPVNSTGYDDLDMETRKILRIRNFKFTGRRFVNTEKKNMPLVNTLLDSNGMISMISKISGEEMLVKPPAEICTRGDAHDRMSCGTCHTGWVPRCIGCHNTYDKNIEAYDLLERKKVRGEWVEFIGKFMQGPPALGIIESDDSIEGKSEISTFMPGMVLTVDLGSYEKGKGELFHRLYAPASGHTTQAKGRSCTSCHNDPFALGFGEGTLKYEINGNAGKWIFIPKFGPDKHDGLPQDAWTGFLQERSGISATRYHMRPFNIEEQKKILTVGACLTCHKENSEVMLRGLDNFKKLIQERSPKCVLPVWK